MVAFSNATYAEFVAVAASLVTHVPDGLELADSAAVPLIALTGDQLVRQAAGVQAGQTVVVTGALGSVGRAAVHTAKKMGARVIAGVRKNQLSDARSLGVADVVDSMTMRQSKTRCRCDSRYSWPYRARWSRITTLISTRGATAATSMRQSS